MGLSLAWIGVQGAAANNVLEALGLSETGLSGEFYRFPIAAAALANGW
jgi:hypothetical protein